MRRSLASLAKECASRNAASVALASAEDSPALPAVTGQANIIKALSPRYVLVYPVLTKITGSVKAALMLSQMLFWTRYYLRENPNCDGWFYKRRTDWIEATGLTRSEQEHSRALLVAAGYLEEQLRGAPATMHFRVCLNKVGKAIAQHAHTEFAGWAWEDAALRTILGRPVAFLRGLVDIAGGSVIAALYLSDVLQQQRVLDRNNQYGYDTFNAAQRPVDAAQGWMDLPLSLTAHRLGVSPKALRLARDKLVRLGLIEEKSSGGMRPRTLSRIGWASLQAVTSNIATHSGVSAVANTTLSSQVVDTTGTPETGFPEVPKPANQKCPNLPTRSNESSQLDIPKPANQMAGLGTSPYIEVYKKELTPLLPKTGKSTTAVNSLAACSSSPDRELQLPKGFSDSERETANRLLNSLTDQAIQQLVADEFLGQMQRPGKITAPLSYLFGLVQRAKAGTFVPVLAQRIAEDRQRRDANLDALNHARKTPITPDTAASATRRPMPAQFAERLRALGFSRRSA